MSSPGYLKAKRTMHVGASCWGVGRALPGIRVGAKLVSLQTAPTPERNTIPESTHCRLRFVTITFLTFDLVLK